MRSGYKCLNVIFAGDKYIRVRNYPGLNEVENRGFFSLEAVFSAKTKSTIGFWRIKRKEAIK